MPFALKEQYREGEGANATKAQNKGQSKNTKASLEQEWRRHGSQHIMSRLYMYYTYRQTTLEKG